MNSSTIKGIKKVGEAMIYTCTMNTAIDLYVELDRLEPQTVNRTMDEDYQPNGKGVNVSIMLEKQGINSVALGFIAGFTGRYIEESLRKMGIMTDFVYADGVTRINVFINADTEYKIVNQGPTIAREAQHQLLEKIRRIQQGDTLIVSGSLPKNVPESILEEMAAICEDKGIAFVLDTSIQSLSGILRHKPFLLKPNEEELADFFGITHRLNEEELIYYGSELIKQGAKQVLISRGAEGSIFINDSTCLLASSPIGTVINTACAGDALLATFIGYQKSGADLEESLMYATATGASTAFSKGLSDLYDVPELLKQIHIRRRSSIWQK